MNDAL